MTEGFIRNNRGIDQGKSLPDEFLGGVYDRIARSPISLKVRMGIGIRVAKVGAKWRRGSFGVVNLPDFEAISGGVVVGSRASVALLSQSAFGAGRRLECNTFASAPLPGDHGVHARVA